MPHFTESLDALRREAPARFLETDQFAEMLSTYHKLKPLAQSKPKSFAKQCAEYDFTRIYPLMDAFLAEHDLSAPDRLVAAAGERRQGLGQNSPEFRPRPHFLCNFPPLML